MSPSTRRPALRWLVPVFAAVLLTTGGAALDLIKASARDGLPARSAAQLLVDVQQARVEGLSGTVVENADLGLPALPGVGGSGSSELTSLLAGPHTLRVWYDGAEHVRLSLMGSLGESDVVRNGSDLWTWSSRTKSATHKTLPDHGAADDSPPSPDATAMTPQKLAEKALAAINPTTKVSSDGTAVVAGRSAYELVLEPRDAATLVDSVRIAIDGKTHLPLRVQVFAKAMSKPALEVGFTSFDPTRPDPSVFVFNPPPGTTVSKMTVSSFGGPSADAQATGPRPADGKDVQRQGVVGSGWTAVAIVPAPAAASVSKGDKAQGSFGSVLGRLVERLPQVSGSWGSGRLLRGTVFSALLTDDGRLVVGAVTPERLYEALAK